MSNYGIRRYTTTKWKVAEGNEIIGTFNTEALAKEYVVFKKVADKMPDQSIEQLIAELEQAHNVIENLGNNIHNLTRTE